jgi:predicted PurR-regulated permease PerM
MKKALSEWPTRTAAFVILAALLVLAFLTIKILLVPLVAASFVTYLFDPGVVVLQRRGLGRGPAFLLIFLVSAVAMLILLAMAPSWLRLESIHGSAASFSDRLEKQVSDMESAVDREIPMFQSINLSSRVIKKASDVAAGFFEQLPSLVSGFTLNLLLVPFIAYFMIRDGNSMRRRIVSLVPNRYFEMTLMMLHRIDRQIGGYLRGRLIECILVAVTQMVAMRIAGFFVGQPQILLISVVCGVTNLIPYLGPVMGAGFGIVLYVGAYGLPSSAVYGLVIAALTAHVVDNIAIAPVVLSHNVDLHPLTVVLVLVIGGELLGVLGLLIAIPVAASVKVIAQELYTNYQMQLRLEN